MNYKEFGTHILEFSALCFLSSALIHNDPINSQITALPLKSQWTAHGGSFQVVILSVIKGVGAPAGSRVSSGCGLLHLAG